MDKTVIGIVAHTGKSEAAEAVRLLDSCLRRHGVETRIDNATAKVATLEDSRSGAGAVEHFARDCSMVVALGGDGLILDVAHRLRDSMVPVFGLNLGTLGFLTCMHWSQYEEAVKRIVERRFVVSKRTMLAARCLQGGTEMISEDLALNDTVLSRGPSSQLIRLQTWINDDVLTEFFADGLIVATPTGSTAYSLSAGGPILSPESGTIVITPICPHVLTNRSVITRDDARIIVEAERPTVVSADGRGGVALEPGDRVVIARSEVCLPLVTLPDLPFYHVLREKMNWAGSNFKRRVDGGPADEGKG
jgi:NAD+ kinase